jgi:hypothetical protein
LLRDEGLLLAVSGEAFWRIFGVRYAPRLRFTSEFPKQRITKEAGLRVLRRWELTRERSRYGRFAANLHAGPAPQVYIQRVSESIGWGVFAGEDIAKGTFVGEYTGTVGLERVDDHGCDRYAWSYPVPEEIASVSLDAEHWGNAMRFVNHSRSPNLEAGYVWYEGAWHVIYVSKRQIPKHTQLTVSYGPDYFQELRQRPVRL